MQKAAMNKIRKAMTEEELLGFIRETREISEFSLKEVRFDDQDEWSLVNGVYTHKSKGFFQVTGYQNHASEEQHLVLFQPQGAFNGLLIHKTQNSVWVLIQARVEPGNTGVCQFGPTIQSTPANFLRLHKGKATPYLDYFFEFRKDARLIHNSTQLDLGKRYFQKTKILNFVEVHELLETAENMIWVNLDVLARVIHKDNFLNTDLRSMLGIFDWDQYASEKTFSGRGKEFSHIKWMGRAQTTGGSVISLAELRDWQISSKGVEDLANRGISIKVFETYCNNREVTCWVQPLVCVDQKAHYTLCIKETGGKRYFLLSVDEEFGILGHKVIMPSYSSYRGNNEFKPAAADELIYQIVQSEEGGRFYQNESLYSVYRISREFTCKQNQFWVNDSELKDILNSSNLVGIQLRCMASIILQELNTRFNE